LFEEIQQATNWQLNPIRVVFLLATDSYGRYQTDEHTLSRDFEMK
jgi:hypothetical protein